MFTVCVLLYQRSFSMKLWSGAIINLFYVCADLGKLMLLATKVELYILWECRVIDEMLYLSLWI